MKTKKWLTQSLVLGAFTSATLISSVHADEGMWEPSQMPEIRDRLVSGGLKIDPDNLSSFKDFPLNAIVSLGGCSASFVSPKGLVVTNHHCVYGSVQYNSTTENNLLEDGFLARDMTDEVPAVPGSRIYVTEAVTDVTNNMTQNLRDDMSGIERYKMLEDNRKALISDCESTNIHRCDVSAFHQGMEYRLIKRLEIRDVRLVYAPATSIGKYGGDIDNWQWPRHTGDWGFYRAYVGKDGKPADYSKDNVPYTSKSFLKVAADGVKENDFVMAAGSPGRTNRYRTSDEIENQFTWYYPEARAYREDIIATIEESSPADSQARLNYESTISYLANYAKNFQSMEESFQHSDFLARRQQQEEKFAAWLKKDSARAAKYMPAISGLNELVAQKQATRQLDLWRGYFSYATLPSVAEDLYRLAVEREKPDAEREPGYQERDMTRFKQSLERISHRYDETVDKAILTYLLRRYMELEPAQHLASVDKQFRLGNKLDEKKLAKTLNGLYKKSSLDDEAVRLAWMDKSVADFKKSKDPFIQWAVNSFDERMALEEHDKEIEGQFLHQRPLYMSAFVAFNRSLGLPVYADANSSLRITYGRVKGNQPKDGLLNLPFTTLEGIVQKDTGVEPFNAPKEELALIREKKYGPYKLDAINSVPVNFLCTLDITGGNSGSATLNSKGELVGLLFDGVYESIIGDWDFDDDLNRAIVVDVRYILWVMTYLDKADNLLKEMSIVRK
ncbi:S46 family peptidase [Teredinibacter turnerae]|uniref:S46 family peptidase n=1 Tax=Teredinibacter turnerae TaxID=2426 RepID=UPI0009E430A1|nr:S46 family peptidase [Teredinibacter turnerae]